MFFPQTSLIPSTIALLDFFNHSFPNFFWYPYWYLGNPFNYLIGPIVPFLSFLLIRLFNVSAEQSFWSIFILSFVSGNICLYFFIRKLGGSKSTSLLITGLNMFLPFSLFMLNFQNGLSSISFCLLPAVLVVFPIFLKKDKLFFDILLIFLIAFLVLIDISILVPIIISLFSLLLILVNRNLWLEMIFKLILIILGALFLATSWYTFGFWSTLIFNPSFGGQPLFNILKMVFDLGVRLIPILIAIWVVKIGNLKLNNISFFGLLFISSFGFLTLLRFMSDPDFVVDWISYLPELQFGGSILLGSIFLSSKLKQRVVLTVFIILIGLFGWIKFYNFVNNPASNEFKTEILELVSTNQEGNYFVSGSSVFFINQYLDIFQLRGGNDSLAINPIWGMASYQIREGKSIKATNSWFKALGINQILVHENGSKDYYLDFKNPEKFNNLEPIGNFDSNILYRINLNSAARVVGKELLNTKTPTNGEDLASLEGYINSLGKKVYIERKNQTIQLKDIPSGSKAVSLAVTFDSFWRVLDPKIEMRSDSLGNILIISESELPESIKIEYNPSLFSHIFPIFFFTIMLYIIFKFKLIAKFVFRKISFE